MKKTITLVAAVILCLGLLAGCGCKHETWNEADCLNPKTCAECGEIEGEPLGHTWAEATCEAPKTCTACGETEGEALGHTWADATCETPKTCTVCGETEGEALGHTLGEWADVDQDNEERACSACDYTEQQAIDRLARFYALIEGSWDLEGFSLEDGDYLPLDQADDPDYWACTFHIDGEGNMLLKFKTGEEVSFSPYEASFEYASKDEYDMYYIIMVSGSSTYATGLFVFENENNELWCQLDSDWWIFVQS